MPLNGKIIAGVAKTKKLVYLLSVFETVACVTLIPCVSANHFTNPACVVAGRLCF